MVSLHAASRSTSTAWRLFCEAAPFGVPKCLSFHFMDVFLQPALEIVLYKGSRVRLRAPRDLHILWHRLTSAPDEATEKTFRVNSDLLYAHDSQASKQALALSSFSVQQFKIINICIYYYNRYFVYFVDLCRIKHVSLRRACAAPSHPASSSQCPKASHVLQNYLETSRNEVSGPESALMSAPWLMRAVTASTSRSWCENQSYSCNAFLKENPSEKSPGFTNSLTPLPLLQAMLVVQILLPFLAVL